MTLGSVSLTQGVRVAVAPSYLPDQSEPMANRFVFGYRVRVTNESTRTLQLMARHWIITDATGRRHEVRGEGVVGHQPTMRPGTGFEYSSFCPLPTPWGTMEGSYTVRPEGGDPFDVAIGTFYLMSPMVRE